ncbi:hypothetical protein [Paraclostridium bifermentans]|uniref:hypothetical protein n=1 Tax=Paraclostridium bifermentans TaxID=1490 RepID=UPI0011DD2692|nr:hypothetical protein [Paraclostridium bifermentans]
MKNKEYKIGQEIKFETYITGNAREMRQVVEGMTIEDYDHRNIAEMIYNRLNLVYGLENFLSDEEIEYSEMIDEMEDVLCEIL